MLYFQLISSEKSLSIIEDDVIQESSTKNKIREWLISPPPPPFTIIIAESKQENFLHLAEEGHDRVYFPILFKTNKIYIFRPYLEGILSDYEYLMSLEITKTEINSGVYKMQTLMKYHDQEEFVKAESHIKHTRETRLLDLVSYIAISPNQKESP